MHTTKEPLDVLRIPESVNRWPLGFRNQEIINLRLSGELKMLQIHGCPDLLWGSILVKESGEGIVLLWRRGEFVEADG